MSKRENEGAAYFTGIPEPFLPHAAPACEDKAHGTGEERYRIVREGPRNLRERPFDYRNPFPLKGKEYMTRYPQNGPNTFPRIWPLTDDAESFDYYVNDNAVVGLPGGPECAVVDVFGTIRCFTGAWSYGMGKQGEAPGLRVRKLESGHIPIIRAETVHGGCKYAFEYFASEIPGAPECEYPAAGSKSYRWVGPMQPMGRNVFIFSRAVVSALEENQGTAVLEGGEAILQLGYAQKYSLGAGAFYQDGLYCGAWDDVRYEEVQGGVCRLVSLREGVMYTLGILKLKDAVLHDGDGHCRHWPEPMPKIPERNADCYATACAGLGTGTDLESGGSLQPGRSLESGGSLEPRQSYELQWIIPCFPLKTAEDKALLDASYQEARQRCMDIWQSRRSSGMQITIPEAKVQDSFLQALNHLDICSVTLGKTEFPTPGPSNGHHILYERDCTDMIYAYDLAGDHERAERMLENYWLCDMGQENCSMILWVLGKHFRLTHNTPWLQRMFPLVTRCVTWLINNWMAEKDQNDGLFSEVTFADAELIVGHFVSYHLYAMAGIRLSVEMAEAIGEQTLAEDWEEFLTVFSRNVNRRLERLVEETEGVLTPGFEGYRTKSVEGFEGGSYGLTGGVDWHNLAAVFPTEVLPPHHPWVTSSLERWRHCYLEGIFPYAIKGMYEILHNYNTMNLSETWLRRGDYTETLRDLYGLLLHTSATHASSETLDSTGRLDSNCTPHNWFSGKLVRFIRDMLVYEDRDGFLHLLGCISPAWIEPGAVLGVRNSPTELGTVSFTATMGRKCVDLEIDFQARPAAKGICLHLPQFLEGVVVKEGNGMAQGESGLIRERDGGWRLPATVKKVRVIWENERLPDLSFREVVQAYIEDYAKRVAQGAAHGAEEKAAEGAERNG